tara:strand:- start:46 stop:285 length:240 start_codon:yes stop_codon:yes gene_type:complete
MKLFEVYVTATYQAQEDITVKFEATNKDEAEIIAQKLAENGKFIGDNEYLVDGRGTGFNIYRQYGDIDYEATVIKEVED